MFRYLSFSWNTASGDQSEIARQLDQALRSHRDWRMALDSTGHRVYTAGTAHGVNDVYSLPSHQGIVVGRLFRRGEPAQKGDITLTDDEAHKIVSSQGQALVDRFWGRYVAFLPSQTGAPRVLRDPTGTLPCYRVELKGVVIALSWLEDLITLLDLPTPPVSWDAVAACMVFGRLGGRETALTGVTQVLAGELTPLPIAAGKAHKVWDAVDIARRAADFTPQEAESLLRETTMHCAQSWASCYDSIVLRLSGGVDSAILLGCLRTGMAPDRITCLNYFSPGSDSDERRYARLAAQLAGTELVERHREGGFNLEEVLHVARTPTPQNYLGTLGARGTDSEVAMARQAGAIFTGAGGDQLFFEFRTTWPAADYLRCRGLDSGFPAAVLDSAHLGRVSFWQSLRDAFVGRSFQGRPADDAGKFLTLMPDEVIDVAVRNAPRFVHPGWLAANDLPVGKFHQVGALVCPYDYYTVLQPETSPERVNALYSQPLLELCLSTPTYTLTKGGQGRALARRAFARSLPQEIATRRSKGGIEQHVATVLRDNLPFARELLLDGHLAREGLLERRRVEAALSGSPSTSAYVSEIHTCIAMEAWAQRVAGSTLGT